MTAMTLGHVRRAARVQSIFGTINFLLPWAVLTTSLLLNMLIDWIGRDTIPPGGRATGGIVSLYGTLLWIYVATVIQVFPFTVMISMTRRAFVLALTGLIVAQALLAGVLLTLLKWIEDATNHWGVGLQFFDLPYVHQDNPFTQMLVFAAPLAALCFLGVGVAAVLQRWGQFALWALLIGTLVAAGLSLAAILFLGWGGAVGRFFTGQPAALMLGVYPAAVAAVLAAVSGRLLVRARV